MQTEHIIIRRLAPDEWKLLRDLSIQGIKTDPDAFGDTLETTLNRNETTWRQWLTEPYIFVAEVEGIPASRITLRNDPTWEWMINGVWTAPQYRRQGLSNKLFQEILMIAREKHIETITIKVNPSQVAACNFYKKLGFKIIDKHHRDSTDIDTYVMKLNILCAH